MKLPWFLLLLFSSIRDTGPRCWQVVHSSSVAVWTVLAELGCKGVSRIEDVISCMTNVYADLKGFEIRGIFFKFLRSGRLRMHGKFGSGVWNEIWLKRSNQLLKNARQRRIALSNWHNLPFNLLGAEKLGDLPFAVSRQLQVPNVLQPTDWLMIAGQTQQIRYLALVYGWIPANGEVLRLCLTMIEIIFLTPF